MTLPAPQASSIISLAGSLYDTNTKKCSLFQGLIPPILPHILSIKFDFLPPNTQISWFCKCHELKKISHLPTIRHLNLPLLMQFQAFLLHQHLPKRSLRSPEKRFSPELCIIALRYLRLPQVSVHDPTNPFLSPNKRILWRHFGYLCEVFRGRFLHLVGG